MKSAAFSQLSAAEAQMPQVKQRSGALLNQFGAAQKTTSATKKLLATIERRSNMAFWRSTFLGGCPDHVHRKWGSVIVALIEFGIDAAALSRRVE
jgi:hypothetical protein